MITTRLLGYLAAFLGASLIACGVWLWGVRAERDAAVAGKAAVELQLATEKANVDALRRQSIATVAANQLLRERTEAADLRLSELRKVIADAPETNSCAGSPAVGAVLDRLRDYRRPR